MKRTNDFWEKLFSGMKKGQVITVLCLSLAFCICVSVLFFSLYQNKSEQYGDYYDAMKPGYLASESVVSDASYYLVDQEASDIALKKAQQMIPPVFSNDMAACLKSLQNASEVAKALKSDEDSFIQTVQGINVSYEIAAAAYAELSADPDKFGALIYDMAQKVSTTGLFDSDELAASASSFSMLNLLYSFDQQSSEYQKMMKNRALVRTGVSGFVSFQLSSLNDTLSEGQIEAISQVVEAIAVPNMKYNAVLTQALQSDVDPETAKVVYTLVPNQIIVEQNTIISEESSRVLLLLSQQKSSVSKVKIVGSILLMVILTGIAVVMFDYFSKRSLHKFEFFLVFLVGSIITSVLAFFGYKIYKALSLPLFEVVMPVFFVPLLVALLSGRKSLGAVCSFLLSSAVCIMPGADYSSFFLCVLGSVSCVYLITFLSKRRDLVIQWAITLALSFLYLFIWFLLKKSSLSGFMMGALYDLFNILLSFVVVSALLPLLEDLFNIPTQFKLRELANARSPILQRLSQEAPGTYSHSMAVADIAETAARAVGANAALVRVGAMYHDIGKIDHAEYFTENISLLGNSPAAQSHENINRNLSVAIIKSHVKLGVEKGKQIGLPQEVLDIIGNHHGNDVVVYFYNEAMKLHEENPEQYKEPKIEEYAYLGQPPQTPEQAIVMLADCSEAACRSIAKPTPNKIEKMITMILIKKIVNKQLSSCGMSITDLNDVVKSLSESLTGRYHSRISYPEEEEKK
jgi:putative nucleotidyltransferase with HDIG domain